MDNQQSFIQQIFILFALGISILLSWVINQYDLCEKEVFDEEMSLQLSWKGTSLIMQKSRVDESITDNNVQFPPDIYPLFFKKIPINRADFQLLLTVPGIGPKLASEIGTAKQRLGSFEKIEDLLSVPGIGRKKMNHFKDYLSFQ